MPGLKSTCLLEGPSSPALLRSPGLPHDVSAELLGHAMRAGTANAMRDVLRQVAWPENHAKVAPAAQGNPCRVCRLTLGLVSARGQGPAVSQVTLGRPNLLRLLVWWLSKWEPDAVCTSIAVAASAEAGIHCDHPNLIDTWVQVFCTWSGGALSIHDDGVGRMLKMAGGRPVRFNAQLPHKTCPVKSRLSDMRVTVT